MLFLEGVYVDRSEEGHKPRFVKVEPPSDVDITKVVEKISQRVIRRILRHLKLSADPPQMAPARVCQGTLAWTSS